VGADLVPIVCVGETLPERDAGQALAVVERQLRAALAGMDARELAAVVVAYEPVWAIGTGRTASAAQAQEVHAHVRGVAAAVGGAAFAAAVRILYGGSVTPANAGELAAEADVDGCLVGGASLEAEGFAAIVRAVAERRGRG
jgi:triosephosphate isomerase